MRVEAATSRALPFLHNLRESVVEGGVSIEATFPRLIANYLLDEPGHNDAELRAFTAANAATDPRDKDAMECQVEFYIGLKKLLNKRPDLATPHFKTAAAKNQTQLVEYWLSGSLIRSQAQAGHGK